MTAWTTATNGTTIPPARVGTVRLTIRCKRRWSTDTCSHSFCKPRGRKPLSVILSLGKDRCRRYVCICSAHVQEQEQQRERSRFWLRNHQPSLPPCTIQYSNNRCLQKKKWDRGNISYS
ncbi:unnamed protein product, partial [Ectocarpus sp. 12 AP-2014]